MKDPDHRECSSNDRAKYINNEARGFAAKVELDNRMEALAEADAFLTMKDHKPRFENRKVKQIVIFIR